MAIARRLILALAAGLLPLAAQAGRFELFSGASRLDLSGTTTDVNGATYDLDRDLHIDAGAQYQLGLHYAPEHGWLALGASYARLDGRGSSVAAAPAVFGPLVISTGSQLHSRTAFDDYSLAAEAPLRYAGFEIEPGLTVKYLHGRVTIANTTAVIGGAVGLSGFESVQRIDRVFPLAHLRLARDVTGWLRLVAEGNFVEYGRNEVYEYGARADLRLLKPVSASIGYQRRHYRVETGPYRTNASLEGLFFGLSLDTGG
ncbi:MAG: hypothetical protein NVS9B10_08890 [Nevskia sp.]